MSTWDNKNWRRTGLFDEGNIGHDPIWTERALLNRQNPKLAKAASIILEREDLLVNHDRYGLFRPTKTESNGKMVKNAAWGTNLNLHLDMNPWCFCERKSDAEDQVLLASLRYKYKQDFIEENNHVGVLADNKVHIQGLINLADNREEDGGFQVVPGFKHHLKDWTFSKAGQSLRGQYGNNQTFIVLRARDPIHKQSLRVTARAGSIVIWDQRTTHGSRPNNSDRIRYAQFFKMFPAPMNDARQKARIRSITENIKSTSLDTSKLASTSLKVLGLVPWQESSETSKSLTGLTTPTEEESLDEDES